MSKRWMLFMTSVAVFLSFSSSAVYADTREAEAEAIASFNKLSSSEKRAQCKEDWKRYRESTMCFAPYVNVNGTVKAEAFEKCQEVPNPGAYCGPAEWA